MRSRSAIGFRRRFPRRSVAFGSKAVTYTDYVTKLIEALAAELERPRQVSAQVVRYIERTYEVDEEAIGAFLESELTRREDDEIDLILSPLFTPKLPDQTVFAELLGRESVPRQRWNELVRELAARPTRARLVTSDGKTHAVPLREVTIERYLHRLRLDGSTPESILNLLEKIPSSDRPVMHAVARRAIWESASRGEILSRYVAESLKRGVYRVDDAVGLLNLVESYKPSGVAELLSMIPHWQELLRKEIDGYGPKPFFNQRAEELHGGDRDQRRQDEARIADKREELEFLDRLQQLLP